MIVSLAAALLLSACGGGEPESTPQPSATATPGAAQAGSQPAVQQPATATPSASSQAGRPSDAQATPEQDAQFVTLPDIQSSMSALDSYRARFNFSFEGKDKDGKAVNTQFEVIQEVADNKDQRVRTVGSGSVASGTFELLTVGGVRYMYVLEGGTANCVSFSSDQPASAPAAMINPEDVIGSGQKARLVEKGVTINGIKTDRYALDESASIAVVGQGSGEAWVAQEGGFIVRLAGTATGKTALFDNAEGTAKWEYQVEDINNVSRVELPEACVAQKPADDIPAPASAKDKAQFGNVLTFKTGDTIEQVVSFYQTELPKLGWTQKEVSEVGDMRILDFTKGDRSLNITINKSDSGTEVLIVEKKGE